MPVTRHDQVVMDFIRDDEQVVAQADADPTAASLILSLESAFAAISGALVLHESMTLRQLLGCAVIFCAVILSNLPEKQAKLPNEPK